HQHQHQHQHQHAASSTAESRHVSVFVTFLSSTGSCEDGEGAASCQLRQRQQRLRQKGQRPASVHCHHRLEGVQAGAKAELKEVVINNQHAGFEFDMPRKQKIDQQKNQDLSQAKEPRLESAATKNQRDLSQQKEPRLESAQKNQDLSQQRKT
uniref:Secreted protein n=1 Tax=Macrostomum lignano TaxID=282301 RepID=A0A1I8FKK3_9PLAT